MCVCVRGGPNTLSMPSASSIKACVPEATCGKNVANELLHSGYSQGQTRGFVCTSACYLITQLFVAPWDVPQVKAALESFARLQVTDESRHKSK